MEIALPNKLIFLIRDSSSIFRQALRLPHNRTRAQILAAKKTFDKRDIQDLRVVMISKAFSLPINLTRGYTSEFLEIPGINQDDIDLWNRRGSSMMSRRDRTTLYALVRAYKPKVCVETGPGAGSASHSILQAMDRNNCGELYSIDVAGPYADDIGNLIPSQTRRRWSLHLQDDAPLLPDVLDELQTIDFFLHDSNHSYRHMKWEFELAWNHLQPGGILASHDIVATSSFTDFQSVKSNETVAAGLIGNFGFLIKGTNL